MPKDIKNEDLHKLTPFFFRKAHMFYNNCGVFFQPFFPVTDYTMMSDENL